jgi:hypothetical protein
MTKMPKIRAPLSTTGPKKIDGADDGLEWTDETRRQTKFSVDSVREDSQICWVSDE